MLKPLTSDPLRCNPYLMSDELQIALPIYYTINCKLNESQITTVVRALRATPIAAIFFTDPYEHELAAQLCETALKVTSLDAIIELATQVYKETGQPFAVLGEAACMDIHYDDGTKHSYTC